MMNEQEADDIEAAAKVLNERRDPLEFDTSLDVADLDVVTEKLIDSKVPPQQKSDIVSPTGFCSCFTLAYYQPYFNVDTCDIQQRLLRALVPFKTEPTFIELVETLPDAYGPFWISSTLIFSLASCSNLASYAEKRFNNEQEEWSYDFSRVASAFTLVYLFFVGLPLGLWTVGRYTGVPLPLTNLLCLYGYSLLIFIPASIMCVIPVEAIDWIVMLFAMAWSLLFLLKNLWPILSQMSKEKLLPVLSCIG